MAAKLLGAHMPTSKGYGNAVREGKRIGCDAVQIFTSSPQQWRAKEITDAMVEDLRAAREETGIRQIVSHDSYLINLCSVDEEHAAKSFQGLKGEIERCARLEIPWVVSHMGSSKNQTEAEALPKLAQAALELLRETPDSVTLLMETTAGQGSALNAKFEQLAEILERCGNPDRLAVCLDTCHVFVAGYDLRDEVSYEATFARFDALIGLEKLKVIHCNDSKKPLGSRVDRHAHIGEGEIGPNAFERLVNDPRFENVPILLETPEAPEGHERNLQTLRSYLR